ncbi:malectin [Pontiella agarivorans]|uniref:Malectin n=1 Tax=Pontiella agarivorans TaxID=3038953 RepID=A0ABU5MZE9_9BACT|nr:malectin [Pontiella agarivorans]MDZ8119571.1 malectin [Pontiella agarivorans]
MTYRTLSLLFAFICSATASENIAYIHGDIAKDGTTPSGGAAPYDQMLLTDAGNTGCSQFKALVEAQGYTISQHYDAETDLDADFLEPFDVIIFGLHQKIWSADEKAALDTWIRDGGGILMYSDSAAGGKYNVVGITNPTGQNAVNNILSHYGMEVTVDQGGGVRAYFPDAGSSNPIIWDQPVFEGEGVSPIAVDPASDAQILIPLSDSNKQSGGNINPGTGGISIANPQWAVIALNQIGNGNVIAIFDRQPLWNNGPGSDINKADNKEVLRRIVRYLARDYGNSSDWINLISTNSLELTYRQWNNGTGIPGFDYHAKNTRITIEHTTALSNETWSVQSNWVEHLSSTPESSETERTSVRILPDPENLNRFARVVIKPATNSPPAATNSAAIAINCGSSSPFTGTDGTQYQADVYFAGGHTDNAPGTAVANTDNDALYNEARSNFTAYNIPLANGSYTVTLKFAETWATTPNQRVFDIAIEGNPVINNLDLFAAAPGKWVAYDLEFPVTVNDGQLNLTASASINNVLLNAIMIVPD